MSKKKTLPIYNNVKIEAVAAEGKCITHIEDKVIFVPFVVPGDIVDLQVVKKKHKYCEAKVIKYIQYSDVREKPFCSHFGICGGCKWQNLPYQHQLQAKQKQVYDQLSRIGKVELPEFHPILGSTKTQEYRNKLEFGCCNKRWLTADELQEFKDKSLEELQTEGVVGFHISGAFDKIYPIEKCYLMDDLCNQIRNAIRDYAINTNMSFYDIRNQKGLLRDIMIRNSHSGEWMVLIQFCFDANNTSKDEEAAKGLLKYLSESFPQITSLLYVNNQKGNDTFGDLPIKVYKGNDYIYELMDDLKFKVRAKSFYQTNTEQAFHLYNVVKDFAQLSGKELVYDLYTGTGTIANFIARQAKKVIGIEYVEDAIEDAKENSLVNNIDNTLFYAGDMKNILTKDFIDRHGRPDVIVTDPPRAGMHSDVVKVIIEALPKKIVYVSCNPATQARDLNLLDNYYKITAVQPVDMFPHTPHVENVVALERRNQLSIDNN